MIHSQNLARMTSFRARGLRRALTPREAAELPFLWEFWARPPQLLPDGDWVYWLPLGGRGCGKTRTGAEAVRRWAKTNAYVNIIGAAADDVRDVMVEGESGLINICPPDERPKFVAARNCLEWPNGARTLLFSAEAPERLRGKQHCKLWADELAAWRYPEAWDQAVFGLRLGDKPQAVITTTPRPTKLIRELLANPLTHATRATTYDNLANLPQSFIDRILRAYEGTRLGRQELDAELLLDTPGALRTRATLEAAYLAKPPALTRVVVAIDPPASSTERADECGVIVAGLSENGEPCVLADLSSQGRHAATLGQPRGPGGARFRGRRHRRRGQQRRRHGGDGDPPDRRQCAREIRARQQREVYARRTGGGFVRAGARQACRRVREVRRPDVPDDAGVRPPRGGIFAR